MENQIGTFDVSMTLFTDKTFKNEVDEDNFSISVPEPLFVGLELSNGSMILSTEKCWATPRLVISA